MMKIKFVDSREYMVNAKATIHKSGKLGFSHDAAKKLNLNTGLSLQIGINESDESDGNLYAVISDKSEESGFNIVKAGDYFYVNAKNFFDSIGIDYRKNRVIFDIVDIEYEGRVIYKFIRREKAKKE